MRRSSLIAIAIALGIVLAACSTQQSQPPDVIVNTGQSQTGISVSGTGEVTGTPDTVEVDIGVSVLGKTVEEAASMAADKADGLISALTSKGVAKEDITTTNYSIYPEYDYSGNTQKLVGYRVTNTVRAKIRDIASSGNVIDRAVAAGGDAVQVNGLSFSIEDNTELIQAARDAAWKDAFDKATQLAELSGRTLGPATAISETFSAPPVPIFYGEYAAAADSARETPIQPGTSAVTVNLSVQFSFEG